MASYEPGDLPVVEPEPSACRHLRNKGMYVYTDDPGGDSADDYDNTNYWCFKTMKSFGPDDEMVGGRQCRDPSRTCYEPI
jgi:hypothetical protein